MIGMIASLLKPGLPEHPDSSQYHGGRFNNAVTPQARSLWEGARLWWDFLFAKPEGTVPDRAIPVQVMTREGLIAAPDNSVWRLGHSSLLFKLQGKFWLTDPVFSERASPVGFLGPKRAVPPGIASGLLAGILLIGHIVGSFELSVVLAAGEQIRAHALYPVALVLVLLGAFTKSAQFPFHFWLPHAMAAPTPVSAYLHSATMVKAGVFLLARFWPVLSGSEEWFWIVGGAGACTLLLGAYAATAITASAWAAVSPARRRCPR